MRLTKVQREILTHLRDGGRLNRREQTCQRVYEFRPDKDGRIILAATIDRMMALGLIYVGWPPERGSTTHLITELGNSLL